MKKLINLTPHDIHILNANGELVETLPKSDNPLRVESENKLVDTVNGYGIYKTMFGELSYTPVVDDSLVYVVSMLCAKVANRVDFLIVNDTVRNAEGNIVGCKSFARMY